MKQELRVWEGRRGAYWKENTLQPLRSLVLPGGKITSVVREFSHSGRCIGNDLISILHSKG
jgi:hypothetical protein